MSELTYLETIERWNELNEAIKRLQAEERALREGLFRGTFKNPVEGTNTYELPDGRKLKGTYKLYRNVDEKNVGILPKPLQEKVFRVKHDLQIKVYRNLTSEERKQVDGVLTVKPGLPGLELVPVKESK